MVRRLNNALLRADRIEWAEGKDGIDYLLPIVADAEAGFGGPLNAFELMKGMIEAGAAAVHFEDRSSEKKCGHLGGRCSSRRSSSSARSSRHGSPPDVQACRRSSSPAPTPTRRSC